MQTLLYHHMANFGAGLTKRERPRKAFDSTKANYPSRLDFGKSTIPDTGIYRARWSEKKSWFWITVRLVVLGFILFFILGLLFDARF